MRAAISKGVNGREGEAKSAATAAAFSPEVDWHSSRHRFLSATGQKDGEDGKNEFAEHSFPVKQHKSQRSWSLSTQHQLKTPAEKLRLNWQGEEH